MIVISEYVMNLRTHLSFVSASGIIYLHSKLIYIKELFNNIQEYISNFLNLIRTEDIGEIKVLR